MSSFAQFNLHVGRHLATTLGQRASKTDDLKGSKLSLGVTQSHADNWQKTCFEYSGTVILGIAEKGASFFHFC